MNITTIELEKGMYDIAKKYFGLIEDDYQRVIIEDGMQYLQRTASLFHFLLFKKQLVAYKKIVVLEVQ